MTAAEQRALEALKDAARVVERVTSGPSHDSPEPDPTSVVEAKARLTLAAKSFARVEREAKNAKGEDQKQGARVVLGVLLRTIETQRDQGASSISLGTLEKAIGMLMPKDGAEA